MLWSSSKNIVATTLEQAGFEQTKPHVVVDVDEFEFDTDKGGRWDEDAEFIAEAKDDIQWLLDLVQELIVECPHP